MPHSSSHVHDSSGICMAAGAARGLAVEAAGGTAVRAATAEAPREVKASMDDCNQDDNQLEDLRTRVISSFVLIHTITLLVLPAEQK